MSSANDMMFEYLKAVRDLGKKIGASGSDLIEDAIANAPINHTVHRLAATAWRCAECGGVGFLPDLTLVVDRAAVGCPHCGSEDKAEVLSDVRTIA